MNEFQIDVDQIRGHADTVGTIANGLHDAAGTTHSLNGAPFGIFVQFLSDALAEAANNTIGAIGTSASTMDGIRDALTGVADNYENTDQGGATNMNHIGGTL